MAKETVGKTKKSNKNTKKVTKAKKEVKTKKTKTKGQEVMQMIETNASIETKKMLIILGIVIIVLGVFYLIAGLVTGNIKLGNKDKKVEIQYSEILAGSTFKQSDTEYVVLYYNFTDTDANNYTSLVSTYTTSEENNTLYTVDLSRKFNSSYIREENETANKNATKATELKLTNPTLIKIKDKKIVEYIEGYEEIKNYMG